MGRLFTGFTEKEADDNRLGTPQHHGEEMSKNRGESIYECKSCDAYVMGGVKREEASYRAEGRPWRPALYE